MYKDAVGSKRSKCDGIAWSLHNAIASNTMVTTTLTTAEHQHTYTKIKHGRCYLLNVVSFSDLSLTRQRLIARNNSVVQHNNTAATRQIMALTSRGNILVSCARSLSLSLKFDFNSLSCSELLFDIMLALECLIIMWARMWAISALDEGIEVWELSHTAMQVRANQQRTECVCVNTFGTFREPTINNINNNINNNKQQQQLKKNQETNEVIY